LDAQAVMKLLPSLIEGSVEDPPWSAFLEALRTGADAEYASLSFGPMGRPNASRTHLRSGVVWSPDTNKLYSEHVHQFDPLPYFTLKEDVPYRIADLLDPDDPDHQVYARFLTEIGMDEGLLMRVRETSGVSVWLAVARRGRTFEATVVELMRGLAPYLRSTMRGFVALERERYNVFVTDEAIGRLDFGWFTLDASGYVVECDGHADRLLRSGGPLSRRADGRLSAHPKSLELELYRALQGFAANRRARGRAIVLSREPWTDMLLVPTHKPSILKKADPVVIAYVHRDGWPSADRCEQLAELFSLTPAEARLALALSRGMTLASAAGHIGVKVETARTYTKRIYGKLGVKGQSDLVRLIMQSVLVIA
jgi:DNA-binding CsgD family transcriptional regulator